jgi:hypothetical protein
MPGQAGRVGASNHQPQWPVRAKAAKGGVGRHRPEPHAGLLGSLDQFHGQPGLGPKRGIPLASREP